MADPDISFFIGHMGTGGAERVFSYLSNEFAERGYSIDLLLSEKKGTYLSTIPEDVRIKTLQGERLRYQLPDLIKYMRNVSPSVFLSTLKDLNFSSIIARKLSGARTKLVIRAENIYSKDLSSNRILKSTFRHQLVRYLFPYADDIIAISEGVKQDLTDSYDIHQQQLHVIGNPISKQFIERNKTDSHGPVQIPDEDHSLIMSAGRLVNQKDFNSLINAFSEVHESMQKSKLMILGEGPRRAQIEQTVRDLNLENHVFLPGFQDNPFPYFRKADVFVLSSRWEGFGCVLQEAIACQTPVVSTNVGAAEQLLKKKRFGRVVPRQSPSEMARAILDLIGERVSPGTVSSALEPYSIDKIADEYEKVLFS